MEKDLVPEKNDDIAETFNDFFTIAVSNLNVPRCQDPFTDSDQTENQIVYPIRRIIDQYKSYPRMVAIKNQSMDRTFFFPQNHK